MGGKNVFGDALEGVLHALNSKRRNWSRYDQPIDDGEVMLRCLQGWQLASEACQEKKVMKKLTY